ncbi:MAG: NRDE family protein, partial [Candidatus Sericytochromatia bacterium]|nr:NRDE family protein [Candidatus Tanganyikabacteria bacterium]
MARERTPMCLLVALHAAVPGFPLVVAANRDEFLERPAEAMAVLRERGPRILGGRDLLAGGTWLAVSDRGLFAALTNFPSPVRDPARRSRGELPLALAAHASAGDAVTAFCREFRPADFNPAWILVGDRHALWYIDFTAGDFPLARQLPPGIHVLENRPLDEPGGKSEAVRAAVAALAPDFPPGGLWGVLAGHAVP